MPANHEVSFMIGASMAAGFASTFAKASSTMGDLQQKVSMLSKNQDSIAAFGILQEKVAQTGAKFNLAQNQVDYLARQIQAT